MGRCVRLPQRGIAVARAQRAGDSLLQRAEKLVLRLHQAAQGAPLHLGDELERGRHAEVGLEQQLLELLERARRHAAAREHGDVGERDVLDALPQRALRYVTCLSQNPHAVRETQSHRIHARWSTAPRERHVHHAVGGRAAPPPQRRTGAEDTWFGHDGAPVTAPRSQPIEERPEQRAVRVSALPAAKPPSPEA